MATFIVAIILLVSGFFLYSRVVEKIFGADPNRKTPCYTQQDGVDYIPMKSWKVYMIQFLNIAGTGPIFGAIMGVLYGPSAYIWIVFGCIFGGAVHDYISAMISVRQNGAGLHEIVGSQLGNSFRIILLVISVIILILVGAVFVITPAGLLGTLTEGWASGINMSVIWIVAIFAYYILATLLPIDKLIGRLYPIFGAALLIMAVGVCFGVFTQDGNLPEITDAFKNWHPAEKHLPIFPGLCITIACGAISGFHATQSPLMARCIKNEKLGRPVFYGAMITEGLVAMIWAAAAIKFADTLMVDGDTPYQKLLVAMTSPDNGKINPAVVVNQICHSWLGTFGAVLAILGVVAAPITSGDTAFRSVRLIVADFMHLKQNKFLKRLIVVIPVFIIAFVIMSINFEVLWRYFAFSNQGLSVFTLWTATVFLAKYKKWTYCITLLPALFMTAVCSSYIIGAPEGFALDFNIAYIIGAVVTLTCLTFFIVWLKKYRKNQIVEMR